MRKLGDRLSQLPIPDRQVPASLPETLAPTRDLAASLESGKAVGIHCRAEIGRSSLMAGCVLVQLGHKPDVIVPLLCQARGLKVPDAEEQLQWLQTFARKHSALRSELNEDAAQPGA